MAAIVNTRDLKLRATVPRIEQVTLDSNITVPSAQVDGLPEVIAGTKVVYLRATSEVFQIAKSGTVAPASIDLSASLRNMVSSPTWGISAGSATLSVTANGGRTLAYADMATDSVTITVSAMENDVTYSDTITIVKLREGTDTINMILSNESHSIPADSTGTAQTYTGAGTTVTIYVGTTDTTSKWTLTKVDSTGVTSSIANNQVAVTNMTSSTVSGYVNITATRAGFPTLTKQMSLTKPKAGTNGTNGDPGTRGTVNVTISGYAAWPVTDSSGSGDTKATQAFYTAYGQYPINRDILTLYDTTHSTSKFYNNNTWVKLDSYIDGNLLVSGTLSADKIDGGTITGSNIDIDGNFKVTLSYGTVSTFINAPSLNRGALVNGDINALPAGTASSSGTGEAMVMTGGSGNILTIKGGSKGIVQQGTSINYFAAIFAAADNTYTLGGPSNRWNSLYVASGVVDTSDARTKTDVRPSDLGLDFIKTLNPVSYLQVVAENVVDYREPHPVEVGPLPMPVETITQRKGVRRHYGLIAQEVQANLKKNGVEDAAFWIMTDPDDPDSMQGLRYSELISPLIKAVQELTKKVEAQEVVIATLKKKVSR